MKVGDVLIGMGFLLIFIAMIGFYFLKMPVESSTFTLILGVWINLSGYISNIEGKIK